MMREKIKIRKIDCLPARQVTFSKRRRGILKKAGELSVPCESEAAVIIFSQTGKLFDFSSSSTKDVIARKKKKITSEITALDKKGAELLEAIKGYFAVLAELLLTYRGWFSQADSFQHDQVSLVSLVKKLIEMESALP